MGDGIPVPRVLCSIQFYASILGSRTWLPGLQCTTRVKVPEHILMVVNYSAMGLPADRMLSCNNAASQRFDFSASPSNTGFWEGNALSSLSPLEIRSERSRSSFVLWRLRSAGSV